MVADYILSFLRDNPHIIGLLLGLAVIFAEDATIITAAVLAVGGKISTFMALTSLFGGIFLGESVCYLLGHLAHRNNWIRKIMAREGMYKVMQWLQNHLILAILAARYVPGMRIAIYGALGFYKFNIRQVLLMSLLVIVIWTGGLFFIIREFGTQYWDDLGHTRWLAVGLFSIAMLGIYYTIQRRIKRVMAEASSAKKNQALAKLKNSSKNNKK